MPNVSRRYKTLDVDDYEALSIEAIRNDVKVYGQNSALGDWNDYLMGNLGFAVGYDEQGYKDFYELYVGPVKGVNTNWVDEVTRKGLIQEYGVDIQSGGSDSKAVKYFLSLNYLDNKSIVRGKDETRYSIRLNMEQAPSKVVKFGINTNFSYSETNLGAGGGYFSDPITQAYMMSPAHSVKDERGEWFFDTLTGHNPVAQRSELGDKSLSKQARAIISPWLQLNFTDNLFFMSRGGADFLFLDEFGYWSFLQPQGADMRGLGENNNSTKLLLSITNTLNYIKSFNNKHNLNVLIGQEGQRTNLRDAYLASTNYPVDYKNEVSLAAAPSDAATYKYSLVLASFFSNVQYDYNNKYYASASLRYDASSRFDSNNRWAPFWSVGAKYRISSEEFMESTQSWLNNLTIRSSYGTSGNQDIGNVEYFSASAWYTSRDLYRFGQNYNGLPGSSRQQLGNPDLKWEQTAKFNVGIDFAFLDRFNVEFDYYNHQTKDMVFAVPVSMLTGMKENYRNAGELSNVGIEFMVNAMLIRTKDFKWDITLTGSKNKNKIKKLSNENPIETNTTIIEAGRELHSFKMKEWAGVDPQTGEGLWYLDETGDETTTDYALAAKRYVGSANPKFQGSFTNNFAWRGFDLSFQFNYSVGGKIYGSNLRFDEHVGSSFGQNFTGYVYDNRWQNPGDVTDVPKVMLDDASNANAYSSRFLMKGDYLKLRSLTVGYNFPRTITQKMHMNNLRIFMNADNVFTISAKDYRGFDPSGIGADGVQWWNFPVSRNFVFGVTVGF